MSVVFRALSAGLATRELRWLQAGWALSSSATWTFFIVLAVYAYGIDGATAVSVAALARMLPAGLCAPSMGVLVDRHSRRDVLLVGLVVRAGMLAAIAAAMHAGAPFGAVLALAALVTVATAAHKPAQAALLTSLAQTPAQLGAANALWTGIDNASFLVGSLIGGLLLAATSASAACGAAAVLCLLAALITGRLPRDPVPSYRQVPDRRRATSAVVAGFREVVANADVRIIVAFLSVTTLVEGAIDVLVVVIAIGLLDLGSAGVGWLNAAWGVGGVAGSAAALAVLGRGRLSAALAGGGLIVGVSLMIAASALATGVAIAMLAAVGLGYALIESAGLSLLQRLTSDEVLGRTFAVVETTYWLTNAIGAMLAAPLVALLGGRSAIVAVGACLPLAVVLRWRALVSFERAAAVPEREFGVLRELSLFAPLPMATVENIARRVRPLSAPAGRVVVRRGDPGDEFFVVADGVLDVSDTDGMPPPLVAGDFFGEIALLGTGTRTATVTARDDATLYVLDRDAFLSGVGTHARSSEIAAHTAATRLRRDG